jgi:hypothetical protein
MVKLPTYPDYKKQHDELEKTAKARKAALEKDLSAIDDAREAIILLYRKFDKAAKKIAKNAKTDDDDKQAVADIKAMLNDGDTQFKIMEKTVKALEGDARDFAKLRKEAQALVKDLETQAKMLGKTKAPDASKFDTLAREAKRTDGMIEGDLVKHRFSDFDPARDRKDYEKDLNKFIDLIVAGKHRKEEEEEGAWMTGLLSPAKVLETDKRVKAATKAAYAALKAINDAIAAGRKSGEMDDLTGHQQTLKTTLEMLDKLKKSYARQFKLTKLEDVKAYFQTPDGKKLSALRKEIDTEHTELQRLARKAGQDLAKAAKEIDRAL